MKVASSFLVLIYWVSSWFPVSADRWAVFTVAGCILGLIAALLAQKSLEEHRWPAKVFSVLAFLLLIGGTFFAFMTSAVGTPAVGFIVLFFTLGGVGYLLMIRTVFALGQTNRMSHGAGFAVLFLLATWSWASALGMYFHVGAANDTTAACILVPKPNNYDTELNSVWEMRLPEFATSRTGPTGTTILDYHAILVTSSRGQAELYNWSKKRMRFEILNLERNPYLPTECP
ncbi:hypothetical protein AB9F26_11575 [Falsihalocynthiibacter sp. BN13B15]|uniref:hypothetical protein n=1 Tax=Falsihalocynthiibacter sp. BN13B15 TaxID=3240871 RepID=UPI0035104874